MTDEYYSYYGRLYGSKPIRSIGEDISKEFEEKNAN